MEFTLKKILSLMVMPLSVGLILLLIGLVSLYFNKHRQAKFYLTTSFLWIFIFSYAPFSNTLLKPLESQFQKIDKQVNAKYILLLGGDYNSRAPEAIRLYYKLHGAKIITSGYPGLFKKTPLAVINANRLISIGIPKEDILMQSEPKDTQEEAVSLKKMIGYEKFILVTSAYHMPRAIEIFKKEGLNPIPAPTNFLARQSHFLSAPNGFDLLKSEIAFHEYLGKIWNEIKSIKSKYL